jgi:protein-tyrosine kinase
MGRVEDALRRAAEKETTAPSASPATGVVDAAFPSERPTPDAFPAESPVEPAHEFMAAESVVAVADPVADELPLHASRDSDLMIEVTPDETSSEAGDVAASSGPALSTKLVGDERMLTTSREQYRRLAASLHHMQSINGLKVVIIASAVAGEGKTLTAANLALTFSESYEREVLLIDADLRRPSLARTFGIPSIPGLSDGLIRDFDGKLPLQQVSDRLTVLPAGRATPDPMAGLTSERMRQLIAEAREAFDWVIIDTPPIGLMTDASLLSAIADGTVLVVKANSTPFEMVKRAVESLGPKRMLGVVLNRAIAAGHGDKYYDYYHYAPTTPEGPAAS